MNLLESPDFAPFILKYLFTYQEYQNYALLSKECSKIIKFYGCIPYLLVQQRLEKECQVIIEMPNLSQYKFLLVRSKQNQTLIQELATAIHRGQISPLLLAEHKVGYGYANVEEELRVKVIPALLEGQVLLQEAEKIHQTILKKKCIVLVGILSLLFLLGVVCIWFEKISSFYYLLVRKRRKRKITHFFLISSFEESCNEILDLLRNKKKS